MCRRGIPGDRSGLGFVHSVVEDQGVASTIRTGMGDTLNFDFGISFLDHASDRICIPGHGDAQRRIIAAGVILRRISRDNLSSRPEEGDLPDEDISFAGLFNADPIDVAKGEKSGADFISGGIKVERSGGLATIGESEGSVALFMAHFLNFFTVEAVLTVEDLNQAITANLAGDEAAVRNENIAILALDQGIDISRIRARIKEEIESIAAGVGVATYSAI